MWLYLLIFSISFFAYISGQDINRNKSFLVCYTLFLALFVGLSDMFGGYDRYIYGQIFDSIADGITLGFGYNEIAVLSTYELGYSFLSYLIALLTENRYIYILIITLIIYYCIYKTFERHIRNYPLGFIIFLGMMFFFTFTYLRQVLAFAFAWLSIKALINGDKGKFFLMLVIIALLHKSGIVFAGLLFMPLKKWKPNQVCFILFLCALIGLSGITSSLYDAFAGSGFAQSANDYNADGSARLAYIVEVIFFVWIILNNYERIEETRENMIFLNMAWVFCAMLLLFVRSSDGGRVAWFFTIGIIYIVTLIVTTNETKSMIFRKNNVATIMIIVMLILYIRVYKSWNAYNMLYPYKTFFSNGNREPDWIHDRYEYDTSYDINKFYRSAFRITNNSDK